MELPKSPWPGRLQSRVHPRNQGLTFKAVYSTLGCARPSVLGGASACEAAFRVNRVARLADLSSELQRCSVIHRHIVLLGEAMSAVLKFIALALVVAAPSAVAAPIVINPGDTLSYSFRFNQRFSQRPDWLIVGVAPQRQDGLIIEPRPTGGTLKLYNGSRKLAETTELVDGFLARDLPAIYPAWNFDGCSNCNPIDFSSIRNRTINGRVEVIPTTSFVFDPDLGVKAAAGPCDANGGDCVAADIAKISAMKLNGRSILRQTLFLEFSQVQAPIPPASTTFFGVKTGEYTKRDAGLTPDQKRDVVAAVDAIFSEFNVTVTSTKPPTGPYSTIYVGGAISDLPSVFADKIKSTLLGIAQHIDLGNASQTDIAHVFSEAHGGGSAADIVPTLSTTIAHEAAHIMGLQHVRGAGQLPSYGSYAVGTAISDSEIPTYTGLADSCQNSFQELGRNIGFANNSAPSEPSRCEIFGYGVARYFNAIDSLFLYGAKIALYFDEDSGPTILDLGDLSMSNGSMFDFDLFGASRFAIFGSSTIDGEIDLVMTTTDLTSISMTGSLSELDDDYLYSNYSGGGYLTLGAYLYSPSTGFMNVASAEIAIAENVPEPATFLLVLTGLVAMLRMKSATSIPLTRLRH